jgi:hypothetical protein
VSFILLRYIAGIINSLGIRVSAFITGFPTAHSKYVLTTPDRLHRVRVRTVYFALVQHAPLTCRQLPCYGSHCRKQDFSSVWCYHSWLHRTVLNRRLAKSDVTVHKLTATDSRCDKFFEHNINSGSNLIHPGWDIFGTGHYSRQSSRPYDLWVHHRHKLIYKQCRHHPT